MMIKTKRVYEPAERVDGARVLVDRLWPRGVSKERAEVTEWLKEVAPSDHLREWFQHDPEKWDEFRKRYRKELEDKSELLTHLDRMASKGTLTLLYAAKDEMYNNAVALKEFLSEEY